MAYHPFDHRWTLYTGKTKGFMAYPRYPLMANAMQNNLLLLGIRNARRGNVDSFFVANTIVDKDAVSPFDNATFFPLYLYPGPKKDTLFDIDESSTAFGGRYSNFSQIFITDISNKLNMQFILDGTGNLQHTFGPEDIFNYIYAVFYSPTYRERYAEFLKIDFPRLPLTSNPDLFRDLCSLGEQLVRLHLMERLGKALPKYPIKGNNLIERIEYLEPKDLRAQGQVYINKTQCFDGVPPEVWNFHVGGYQVCHKWLKDRKGRILSFDDVLHYQRIVSVLGETIQIMEQIDETIEEHGGWPLE